MSNIHELEHWRYRLNENADRLYKKDADAYSVALNSVVVRRDRWTISYREKEKLRNYIRTPKNKEGVVDAERFIPATGQVVKDFAKKPNIKSFYRKTDLDLMERDELVEICEGLGIETVRRRNEFLVKEIMKATTKPEDSESESSDN